MEYETEPTSLFGGEPLPSLPGVYQITNEKTGDFYIGGSINLMLRRRGHTTALTVGESMPLLQRSFNKHGRPAFTIRVIELTDTPAIRERHYIRELRPTLNVTFCDHEFNVPTGAAAVGCHENKFSEWWYRTERKLIQLAAAQPIEFSAAIERIKAKAELPITQAEVA